VESQPFGVKPYREVNLPTATDEKPKFRMLVFAPFGKDAVLISEVLQKSAVSVRSIKAPSELVQCIREGADAAIITEEALDGETTNSLGECIASQPPWSDFPLIILTGGGASTPLTEMAVRSRAALGNFSLLERPVRPVTLLSMVRTAARARARQYEIRAHLEELKQTHIALRESNDRLESLVEQRTSALRKLSAHLMRAQDDERRRMARELHDGLGQSLAAAQINLGLIASSSGEEGARYLAEARRLLGQAVSDIRTLSYLLHPPLLEEAGFYSAAQWYVDGFSKRSGITVNLKLPSRANRMPEVVELTLFRVLQEGLINVHRHSGSDRVDVRIHRNEANIVVHLKDYGKGLPEHLLDRFRKTGSAAGVGLAGMRERVKELGGEFIVQSDGSGTLLTVVVPVREDSGLAKAESGKTGPGKTSEPVRRTDLTRVPVEVVPGQDVNSQVDCPATLVSTDSAVSDR
jgi:signal transduction histidine kinase